MADNVAKVSSFLLISLCLIGLAAAGSSNDNIFSSDEKNLTFYLEQRVSGKGFFATYKYASMPDALGTSGASFNGVESGSRAYGSGSMDSDLLIYAESSYLNESYIDFAYDEDGEQIEGLEESNSIIEVKEHKKATYSPVAMPGVSPFYSLRPIVLNSLLKDEIYLKNRNGLNSINHRIDKSHGLDKTLDALADLDINSLKVEEDMIQGTAHFGVIQQPGVPVDEEEEDSDEEEIVAGQAMKDWKKPKMVVDEDYVGTFHIKKSMSLESSSEEEEKEEGWLPCCFNGYIDMNWHDKRSRQVQGIFDCTCFKVAEKAQFAA